MVTLPLPWAACSNAWPLFSKEFFLNIQSKPPLTQGHFLSSYHLLLGRRDQPLPRYNLFSGSCREREGLPSASFSPDYTAQAPSAIAHKTCSLDPSPALLLCSGHVMERFAGGCLLGAKWGDAGKLMQQTKPFNASVASAPWHAVPRMSPAKVCGGSLWCWWFAHLLYLPTWHRLRSVQNSKRQKDARAGLCRRFRCSFPSLPAFQPLLHQHIVNQIQPLTAYSWLAGKWPLEHGRNP